MLLAVDFEFEFNLGSVRLAVIALVYVDLAGNDFTGSLLPVATGFRLDQRIEGFEPKEGHANDEKETANNNQASSPIVLV